MKILTVVRALPIHRLGGLEYHSLDLANGLARRGHEVTILTSAHPKSQAEERMGQGVQIHYMRRGTPGNYTGAFFRQAGKLAQQLDSGNGFDVIHAQEFAGLFMGTQARRLSCTIHGTMFTETALDSRYRSRLTSGQKRAAAWRFKSRLALAPFFRRMLRQAGQLVVDSDFSRRAILELVPEARSTLHMIPLGVDWSRYRLPVQSHPGSVRPMTILLLGRLQEMKGLGIALESARLLRERGLPFRIRIGGAGEFQRELLQRIDQFGLQSYAEYCGRIEPTKLADFFGSGDLFLFPDLTQPAFGLVALESMFYGLPVVGAASGAIPEVVTKDVGWIYPPWDAHELTSLLQKLIENPDLVHARSTLTQARAREFNADRMAEAYEMAFLRTVSPGKMSSKSISSR